MKFAYKTKHSLEERRAEGERIHNTHLNHIPIICEKAPSARCKDLATEKYLVHEEVTVVEFIMMIRRKIELRPEDALFFFCNNTIPQMMSTIGQLWQAHRDEDLFLYISFTDESVYGAEK